VTKGGEEGGKLLFSTLTWWNTITWWNLKMHVATECGAKVSFKYALGPPKHT